MTLIDQIHSEHVSLAASLMEGREKDRDDLFALYANTNSDRLIDRFNVIWKWHGSREAVLGYADSFIAILSQFGNLDPLDILACLKLPEYMLKLLSEAWSQHDDHAI